MTGHIYYRVRNNLITTAKLTLALCLAAGAGLVACVQSDPTTSTAPSTSKTPSPQASTASPDGPALVALYIAADGENWLNDANWLSDSPIEEWHGVTTDDTGRVTGLNLAHNGLTGHIPAELGDLSGLERLELWRNRLSGVIPPELGNLTSMELLDLGENRLAGNIPPELGNLSRLERLYLYVNELSGEIPRELGSLSNLKKMNLSGNQLSGQIPPELGNLGGLSLLDLGDNRLHGKFPTELAELTNLEEFFIGGNDELTGCIDKALRKVQKNDVGSVGLPLCVDTGPSMSGCGQQ